MDKADNVTIQNNSSTLSMNATVNVVHNNTVLPSFNEIDMSVKLPETRKRKNVNADHNLDNTVLTKEYEEISTKKRTLLKSRSASSISSIGVHDPLLSILNSTSSVTQIDLDEVSAPQTTSSQSKIPISKQFKFKHLHNNVQTVTESFSLYKSFIPEDQATVDIAKPPDTPPTIYLNNSTKESCNNVIVTSKNVYENSLPQYSLITLHGNDDINLPLSHLAIQVSPYKLQTNQQNIIPKDFLFMYELLLTERNFDQYKESIKSFSEWAKERNVPIMFTVPATHSLMLQECLCETILKDIQRPFHQSASISVQS
jgi:hypothetical protein